MNAAPPPAPRRETRGPRVVKGLVLTALVVAIPAALLLAGPGAVRRRLSRDRLTRARALTERLASAIASCASDERALPPSTRPVPASLDQTLEPRSASPEDLAQEAFSRCHFDPAGPLTGRLRWDADRRRAITEVDLDGDGSADVTYQQAVSCSASRCTVGPLVESQ